VAIFYELYNLHSAARPIIEQRYPLRDRNLVHRNFELYRALLRNRKGLEEAILAEPKKKLAAKYSIPGEVLEKIYEEGILNFGICRNPGQKIISQDGRSKRIR